MLDAYFAHVLPPAEWYRLGLPPESLPTNPEHALIIVVENADGEICGRWMAYETVVLEGLAIDPAYQKHPGVAGRLMQAMTTELISRGVPMAMTLITDGDVARLAARHGLYQLPGAVWVLDLRPLMGSTVPTEVREEG